LTRVESSLAVVAHLSEAIPRYWLLDNAELERFLESELTFGLAAAVEKKLLVDIAGTSGIALQPYATSTLVTLRKGLTVLEAAGYTPSAAVLHPLDWESVELAITTRQAVEHLSLPYDVTARRLFGVPIVVTVSATPGVGYVLADGRSPSTPIPTGWA
jgi:hypothetical protein